MMHMTFYWSRTVTLLFDSWSTETWAAYALSLVAVFLSAAFYQYLENCRIKLKALFLSKKASAAPLESPLLTASSDPCQRITARCAVAVLFGVNSALGYLLMLAVMSFNGGVFVGVVLGLLAGYLVFRSDGDEGIFTVENPCGCM